MCNVELLTEKRNIRCRGLELRMSNKVELNFVMRSVSLVFAILSGCIIALFPHMLHAQDTLLPTSVDNHTAGLVGQFRQLDISKEQLGVDNATTQSKCNTAGGEILIFEGSAQTNVSVKLEQVQVVAPSSGGVCGLSGKLRIQLPGNNIVTTIRGDVDTRNQFISSHVGTFDLNIGGITLRTESPKVFPDKVVLHVSSLRMPDALGGDTIPMLLIPRIDADNGLLITTSATENLSNVGVQSFGLPDIALDAIGIGGIKAELFSEADGYKLLAEGSLQLPKLENKGKHKDEDGQEIGISAKLAIFLNAQREMVIQFHTPEGAESQPFEISESELFVPADVTAPDGCYFGDVCLSEVGVGFGFNPGIPIPTGKVWVVWITGVRGSITLTAHDTAINLGLTLATSKLQLPVIGPAVTVDGDARLQLAPEFGASLKAALTVFILRVAESEVEYYASSGFRASLGMVGGAPGVPIPIRYEGELRVWGSSNSNYLYSNGPVFVTASGRAGYFIKEGEIYSSCSWIPCGVRWCRKWWGSYPCGVNWCYRCISVPPNELWLGGGTADLGRFKGDIWGIKGAVHFWNYSTGVFFNLTNGNLTLGNVSGYVLDAPNVLSAAMARQGEVASFGVTQLGGQSLTLNATLMQKDTLLIQTPVGLNNRSPRELSAMREALVSIDQLYGDEKVSAAATLDVITSTQVLTQTDTIFTISVTEPLTPSLILPNNDNVPFALRGAEITPDNYADFAPDLMVSYQEVYTYTDAAAAEETRWRIVAATLTPMTLTVQVDGATIGGAVVHESNYMTITPGAHVVTVQPIEPVGASIQIPIDVITGTDTSVMVYFDATHQLTSTILRDSRTPPSTHGKGLVRFINLLDNRSGTLSLYADGKLVGATEAGNASAYVEMSTGTYAAEVRDANNSLILTGTLILEEGDHRSLIATSESLDHVRSVGMVESLDLLADVIHEAVTEKSFSIDQAPIGSWQVKLTGNVTSQTWALAVLNATNPPVLSEFTAQQRIDNPHTVDVTFKLQSDYSPAKATFFVAHAPITLTATMTNADGTVTTEEIANFHGEEVEAIEITDTAELNGSKNVEHVISLSYLPSGDYYLWVQIEDGVNPAVNQYATSPMQMRATQDRQVRIAATDFDQRVQFEGATSIRIDHTSSFAGHFSTGVITPELHVEIYQWLTQPDVCDPPQNDTDCRQDQDGAWGKWVLDNYYPLYFEWEPSTHPDADEYVLEITPIESPSITSTQRITVGNTLYEMYDDENNYLGIVGYSGWPGVFPDSTYQVRVGVIDNETDRIDWSPTVTTVVPLGSIELQAPAETVTASAGVASVITKTISLHMSQDLFYDASIELLLWNLPLGLDVNFVDDDIAAYLNDDYKADYVVSPRSRLVPAVPQANSPKRTATVTRLQADGSPTIEARLRSSIFSETIPIEIEIGPDVPAGSYMLPIRAIAGPLVSDTVLRLQVGDAGIYLPLLTK